MKIYCVACTMDVSARLIDGAEIYPHRPELATVPFWKCDRCGNYVSCHHKTNDPTRPLGVISTKELRAIRQKIHLKLDPMWQSGEWGRKTLYAELTSRLGRKYHTADIRSVEEARAVYRHLLALSASAPPTNTKEE